MIDEHKFNSSWWGSPVGIVREAAFFDLAQEEQQRLLTPYAWVEFRSPLAANYTGRALAGAGFVQVDTQINFRIRLGDQRSLLTCDSQLRVRPATDSEFRLGGPEWSEFQYERYNAIPGVTPQHVHGRYVGWAEGLVAQHPSCCFQILLNERPQGWFLARPDSATNLNLSLAVRHRDAKITGYSVYERALAEYARMGFKVGWASFSVINTAVLNIYSQLGARFVVPIGIWFWIRK